MKTKLVLAEWDGLIAACKPAGVPVHPAGEDPRPDLLSLLRSERPDLPPGLAPAHRLDADVSGVVLLGRAPADREEAGRWFRDGLVDKRYLAVVHGRIRRKGVVRRPLQDARRGRPLPAVTRYRLLEWLGGFSLVELRIETGRKHQIRRHLQGLGHAIVGDERYPPPRFRRVPAFPGRLWLHAARLVLPDEREVEAPLPEELQAHLRLLREGAGD